MLDKTPQTQQIESNSPAMMPKATLAAATVKFVYVRGCILYAAVGLLISHWLHHFLLIFMDALQQVYSLQPHSFLASVFVCFCGFLAWYLSSIEEIYTREYGIKSSLVSIIMNLFSFSQSVLKRVHKSTRIIYNVQYAFKLWCRAKPENTDL